MKKLQGGDDVRAIHQNQTGLAQMRVMGSEFTGVGFRRNQLAGSWCARHDPCTANEMQCIHPTNLRRFKRSSSCCRGEKTRTLCSTFEKRLCRTDGFSATSHYQFQEVSEIISSRSKTRQELSAGFQERDEKEWRCVSEKNKRSCFHGVWKKKSFQRSFQNRGEIVQTLKVVV